MEETKLVPSLVFFLVFFHGFSEAAATSRVKAGYWFPYTNLPMEEVEATLFTHLIYGFVNINSSTFCLSIPPSDQKYFSSFASTVKRRNPSVFTLFTIGGAGIFQILVSMLPSSFHREAFVNSTIQMARAYNYDGINLLQFVPNSTVPINDQITAFNSHQKTISALYNELREAVDSEARRLNKTTLILTAGVSYNPNLNTSTTWSYYPVESIQRNFDWVNLVTYYYFNPQMAASSTHFHAALYDPLGDVNTDFGIRKWIKSGLSKDKIVLGLPFFGCAWALTNPNKNHSLGAPASGSAITDDGLISYKDIKSLYNQSNIHTVYNSMYVESYWTSGTLWVCFDDVIAIKTKVSYALKMGLLGYYVFHVAVDDNWELSRAASDQMDGKGLPDTHEDAKNKGMNGKGLPDTHENSTKKGMDGKDQGMKRLALVVSLIFVSVFALLLIIIYYCRGRLLRHNRNRRSGAKNLCSTDSPDLKIFSFVEIEAATNNFSFENKLGQGGYGPVYKGILRDGEEIAVKRLSETSGQGYDEFKNEVTLAARLQHVNLVKVIGFCTDRDEKMLIYEYLPNKSLDLYLFDPTKRHALDWNRRVEIIDGIIQGLVYLQEYSRLTIIHKDLKASNVLLDMELRPKISDFGLARIFQKDVYEANTDHIVGTYGYIPPEYVEQGVYSMKYDVYSFGVLLLQIISGKRNNCLYGVDGNLTLLDYAYEFWKDGRGMEFIDPVLVDSSSKCKLETCLQTALLCVQKRPEDRPSMLEVSLMLKNGSEQMVTPKSPAFSISTDEGVDHFSLKRLHLSSGNTITVSEIAPR